MDASSVLLQQLPAYPSSSIDSSSSDAPSLSRQYDIMAHLERLKEFLATAPTRWSSSDAVPISQQHPALNRFLLPSNEYVTCVNWGNVHYITGTDIVRALVFRFEAFGRPVRNMKKFEEGVFSDLRNLKPGQDACLEDPKVCCLSPRFLRRFLFPFACSPPCKLTFPFLSSSRLSSTSSSNINAFVLRKSKKFFSGKLVFPHFVLCLFTFGNAFPITYVSVSPGSLFPMIDSS